MALTKTEFGALTYRRVLAPFGLNDSVSVVILFECKAAQCATDSFGRMIPHQTTSTPASGDQYASGHDLALFGLFNMRDRAKAQAAILSEQNIDELHQPVFTGRSGVVTTFGWFKSQTASGFPSSSRAAVIQVLPTECALFRRKT